MRGTITISDLQAIAKKAAKDGYFPKPEKEVKLSSRPDYVDLALQDAERLLKKLKQL